jgi:hypothetical protein
MTKRYRVGGGVGRTIHRDGKFIGIMDSAIDAEWIVNLANGQLAEQDGSCMCNSYDECRGQCCGAGQCSCSLAPLA